MKQSKMTKVMALMLSLTMITSVFVGNTLSRYVTSVSSTDSARVAVWGINAGEDTVMNLFSEDYIVAGKTIANSNTVGEKIMAPGTAGEAAFEIINFEQNVAPEVAYEVKITLDDSAIDEKIKNNSSVQWKLDDGSFGTWDQLKTSILSLSGSETGSHKYGPGEFATAFQGTQEHKIAWQWLMDNDETITVDGNDMSSNEYDTYMGNLALTNDLNAIIKVSITATQTDDLVTNENMLEGANQVVDLNNIQPLTLRSASAIENFQSVKVGDTTLTEGTHYTKTSGSTVITLTETYLSSLQPGRYTISIISSDMTASTVFEVKLIPVLHNDVIPVGGTYYHYEDGLYSADLAFGYYDDAIVYEAGDKFPEPQMGDAYVYGDYEYRYGFVSLGDRWYDVSDRYDFVGTGWAVAILDKTKTQYGEIINEIANLEVTDINYTFYNCKNLITAPVIPETIQNMVFAFANCDSLEGSIEINSNPSYYYNSLKNTKIESVIGKTNLKDKILESNDIEHNGVIPEGGIYYVEAANEMGTPGDYSFATNVFVAGDEFPEPQAGDIYVYEDYEYCYNFEFNNTEGIWAYDVDSNGWGIFYIGSSSEPGKILSNISDKDVISMESTFYYNESIETAPVIPSTIVYMNNAFNGCINLKGSLEINSDYIMEYDSALRGTLITFVNGISEYNIKYEILETK